MPKMRSDVPVHSGLKFSWSGGRGTADISDLLGCNDTERSNYLHGRVWDDACDVGFLVFSPRTGVKKLFTLSHTMRGPGAEALGEVDAWEYTAASGETIRIFND